MAKRSSKPKTVSLTIDGLLVEAEPGEKVIEVAERNGVYIPRFCWHPRLKPVGMCRMCLVEVETDGVKNLTTACTTEVAEGMVVETNSELARKSQEGILEFLLANHPLDCPICDKGGECPLQDQALSHGPGESRFVEEKRHFEKPIAISDLILLDRERCILCGRCTRFAEEIAGDPLITLQGHGHLTEVNIAPDRPFNSYFSGNTVQICPVGALTAVPYRFKARPWDLTTVESVCQHCSTGERIAVQATRNRIVRVLGVDSEATNHGWLSDKCRFGIEYVNSSHRVTQPRMRSNKGTLEQASWPEVLERIAAAIRQGRDRSGGVSIAAIGGSRGTNEDAYALSKFMRLAARSNNLDAQIGDGLDPRFLAATVDRATISQLDTARAILLWGPDLKEEHPTLYLRVRRAVKDFGASLVIVHPRRTGLDDCATHKITYRPGSGPEILDRLRSGEFAEPDPFKRGPVVAILGRPGLGENPRLAEAVGSYMRTQYKASLLPLARRSNVYGALDMGVAPMLLPGRVSLSDPGPVASVWGEVPSTPGMDTAGILQASKDGLIDVLLLVGSDPVRDFPDSALAREGLAGARLLVSIDIFENDSSAQADIFLPAQAFGEKEGTFTNLEGRVQKVNRIVSSPGNSRSEWSIFEDLASHMGVDLRFADAADIIREIGEIQGAYEGISWESLDWEARDGFVAPYGDAVQPFSYVPAEDPGEAVRSEMVLHSGRVMYDNGVIVRKSPSIAGLAPGGFVAMNPEDVVAYGLAPGISAVVTTEMGEATLPVRIDDSLLRGTVYVPVNQPGIPSLGSSLPVQVTSIL